MNISEIRQLYSACTRTQAVNKAIADKSTRNKSTALDKMTQANNESFARELREHPSEDNNLNVVQ